MSDSLPKATLTIVFDTGFESYAMCIDIDESIVREIAHIQPPMKHGLPFVAGDVALDTFDAVVTVMKRKEFRKDLFKKEALRIGTLLAERMEDAEGWHDVSRVEPAKAELRGNR